MKKIFLICTLLISIFASAQTPSGWTKINQKYDWISGKFDSTFIGPAGGATPSLRGGPHYSGATWVDSTNDLYYFYSRGSWHGLLGSTSGDLQVVTDLGNTTTNAIIADQFQVFPPALGDTRAALTYRTNGIWYQGVLSLYDTTGTNTMDISAISNLGSLRDLRVHGTNVSGVDTLVNFGDLRAALPSWQQTLLIGPDLTQNNTIKGGSHAFNISGNSSFTAAAGPGYVQIDSVAKTTYLFGAETVSIGNQNGALGSIGILGNLIGNTYSATDSIVVVDAISKVWKKVSVIDLVLASGSGLTGLGSTDNAVLRANGTGGTTAQGSVVVIDDNGVISINGTRVLRLPNQATLTGSVIYGNGGNSLTHSTALEGQYNFLAGINSGAALTSGSTNVFVGNQVGNAATTATRNTGIGHNTFVNCIDCDYNTAAGYISQSACTSCFFNTSSGSSSLVSITDASYNTGIGVNAMHNSVSIVENTALGLDAGYNTQGNSSTFLGTKSGRNLVLNNQHISIGYKTMAVPWNSTGGSLNIGNGVFGKGFTGVDSTLSAASIGIGILPASLTARFHLPAGSATAGTAPLKINSGTVLAATEAGAIENDGTHLYYTAANGGTRFQLDQQAAGSFINNNTSQQTSANWNIDGNGVAAGYLTAQGYTVKGSTGSGNVGLVNSTTAIAGVNNTIMGNGAGASQNGSSANNTLMGLSAGTAITSGTNITAIGVNAGLAVNTGDKMVLLGRSAGDGITSSTEVVAIGLDAMGSGSSGAGVSYSTAVGSSAALALTGTLSTHLGAYSAYQATSSDYGVHLGAFNDGSLTTGDWNIGIGAYVTQVSNTASGQLNIGNVLYGINLYQTNSLSSTPTATGAIGIGTNAPDASSRLDVTSTTQGFLPPRMTATQGSAIGSPAEGLLIYVTNTNGTFTSKGWWGYNGAAWEKLNN